jgi:quinone-modifying oxidoreductase subunit QmoC
MTESLLLKPDRKFVESIVTSGGGDLKKCFQCATCSVVCELSTSRTPFPRKEMAWAQWGLKDKLFADPDIWRCYQCNDCSTKCPRGARPGDVLAAVREQAVKHYAVPHFLGVWVNQIKRLPLLILIPVILLAVALVARPTLEQAFAFGPPHGFYAEMVPHWLLIGLFTFFTGLAFLGAVVGVMRFWRAMAKADLLADQSDNMVGFVPSVMRTVQSIFSHAKFGKCGTEAPRRWAHILAFYGFLALFATTVWAVIDMYINPRFFGIDSMYPFGMMHPIKILANVGAVLLIVGCYRAIRDRIRRQAEDGGSTSFDWIFVWLLLAVGVTGAVTEILRLIAEPTGAAVPLYTAYSVYFVHLVLVFGLLVYLPYSKFAHIVYRTTALVYAERSGRTREVRLLEAGAATSMRVAESGGQTVNSD